MSDMTIAEHRDALLGADHERHDRDWEGSYAVRAFDKETE